MVPPRSAVALIAGGTRTVVGTYNLVDVRGPRKAADHKANARRLNEPPAVVDIIRDYFVMRQPEADHERVYRSAWQPMQQRLGEERLTEFVRHYLMMEGQIVKEGDGDAPTPGTKGVRDPSRQGPVSAR